MFNIFGILILVYAVIFLYLANIRFDLALMLIIAALPSYLIRFELGGVPFTLLELMILLAAASWIFKQRRIIFSKKLLTQRKYRQAYPFGVEIILLMIVSLIAVGVSKFSNPALGIWKAYFFEPVILFILVINTFKRKNSLAKIFWSLAVSAFLVSLAAIYQKLTGQFIFNEFWAQEANRRAVSFFGYPNAVGLYLAPISILLGGFLFKKIKYLKKENWHSAKEVLPLIFLALTILMSVVAIFSAKSEGALIGLIAGIGFFTWFYNDKTRATTISVLFIIFVVYGALPSFNSYLKNKLTLMDLSGQIRRQQWTETKKMLLDGRVIFGTGLANYQETIKPYHQEGIFVKNDDPNWLDKIRNDKNYRDTHWQPTETYLYPHNIFLNFWSELGIIGALLFSWIILKFLWLSLKLFRWQKKKDGRGQEIILASGAAMMAIVIHGLVDVPYLKNDLSALFWVMVAILGTYLMYYKYDYKHKK